MKKLLKEPLVHFLLIGAAFFLLFSFVGEETSSVQTIVIDESDLNEVVSKFKLQWKREPTEQELTSIINKRVEEEIFYQEALKMNLDHNDEIIKRRLSQKMQFISKDISNLVEPSDEVLRTYYEAHPSKYMKEASYSLHQLFFSPDLRDHWVEEAEKTRSKIQDLTPEEVMSYGDPIALPALFENTSSFHISRQMGEEFTMNLEGLAVQVWQGPITSGYGAHLVYISEKTDAQLAPFDEVRTSVLKDYQYDQEQATEAAIIATFKKQYELVFDIKGDSYDTDLIERMTNTVNGE